MIPPNELPWDSLVEFDDTCELLWCGTSAEPRYWQIDPVFCRWREAQARAQLAYEHWRREAGANAYAAYRAAQDQADSAQRLLELCQCREPLNRM